MDDLIEKLEKKISLNCPHCSSKLKKHKKGLKHENVLNLGVWACHKCEATYLIQNIKPPIVSKTENANEGSHI